MSESAREGELRNDGRFDQELVRLIWEAYDQVPHDESRSWSAEDWTSLLDRIVPEWYQSLGDPAFWNRTTHARDSEQIQGLIDTFVDQAPPAATARALTAPSSSLRRSVLESLSADGWARLLPDHWLAFSPRAKQLAFDRALALLGKAMDGPWRESVNLLRYLSRGGRRISISRVAGALYRDYIVRPPAAHPGWSHLRWVVEQSQDWEWHQKLAQVELLLSGSFASRATELESQLDVLTDSQTKPAKLNVLLDPSIFFSAENRDSLFRVVPRIAELATVYIPKSFHMAIQEMDRNQFSQLSRFYGQEMPSPSELSSVVADLPFLQDFEASRHYASFNYDRFLESVSETEEDSLVRLLILEEWMFLNEMSWIASRSKKVFKRFKQAGAFAIETLKESERHVVRKLLRLKEYEELELYDHLRALGKFIAVGGAAATSLLEKQTGALLAAEIGAFVLLDP